MTPAEFEEQRIKVINLIKEANSPNYEVLSNLGVEKYYIGSLFPDLIFLEKGTKTPVFIIEVKRNGGIAQCIQSWKSAPTVPATLYIIVPETDLANAKAIAQVVGLQTKFGSYKEESGNIRIQYE